MTSGNPSIILLDLENEYEKCQDMLNPRIFRRYTNKIQCFNYLSSRLDTQHLTYCFIPQIEHTIVTNNSYLSNTIYYIYCSNEHSINEMNGLYHFPMFVKIFHGDYLLMNLVGAAIQSSIDQANRTQNESDVHDWALEAGIESVDILKREFQKHVMFNIGLMPNDG